MIRRYKKLFLAFVALFSVFLLASCSQKQSGSKNAAKTETAKVETIDGEWELVNAVDALSDSIGAYPLNALNFARLLDSVKDFKMDLKIENNTATIKYDYNIDNFSKAFYKFSQSAKGKTEEEFKKALYDSHEKFAGDFKKYKVSMNKDTGVFSYEATGSIDQDAKTMTFEEGISVTNSFFFPLSENNLSPNTYHYELKDDMLYITIEGKSKRDNLPVHYELHFKRKGSTTQKDPVPIEGKWQAIDFRPTLERSLAYKDFDYDDSAFKHLYPEAWKDLKPTLNITGTSVEFDYTVSLADGFGRFYDYLKQLDASKLTETKDEFIKNQFTKLSSTLQAGAKDSQNITYEFDKDNYKIHSVLKNGKLDTTNQTIVFPEAINIVDLVIMSIGPANEETTYKYSIDGDILTLTIEQSDAKNNVNTIISAKFKKVSDKTSN
ncbi:hypothetical protein PNV03_07475 [Streptococcus parasanguinis]|uniref:hypothetical protein n=1 Tax=Streptococcus parasanguinis TaxID=1318 RepID=UPI00189BBBE0|nr:hypothetical protein [Streptococcus parasanguinis]MDB8622168.1 hypothetical protein [Streptococcus parasanguinis]